MAFDLKGGGHSLGEETGGSFLTLGHHVERFKPGLSVPQLPRASSVWLQDQDPAVERRTPNGAGGQGPPTQPARSFCLYRKSMEKPFNTVDMLESVSSPSSPSPCGISYCQLTAFVSVPVPGPT